MWLVELRAGPCANSSFSASSTNTLCARGGDGGLYACAHIIDTFYTPRNLVLSFT